MEREPLGVALRLQDGDAMPMTPTPQETAEKITAGWFGKDYAAESVSTLTEHIRLAIVEATTAEVARLAAREKQIAEAVVSLAEIKTECERNIDCNHPGEDDEGGDECDGEDCIGCQITQLADGAIEALQRGTVTP